MTSGSAVREGRLEVGGNPLFVYSGEIHYFRIDPKDWTHRLKLAKEAGLNTVSSYIPWRWHEPAEGKFDFTGKTHPGRNLVRWMDAVTRAGLKFIARIGPVSNAELIREGLPDWLVDRYPEIHLQGKPLPGLPHITIIAYRSPVFLEKVAKWYAKLAPYLKPYDHSEGGCVILTQLCNEIGMVHWLNRAADLSPRAESAYQEFLKSRYGVISELNRAWKASHKSWAAIRQPRGPVDEKRWAECVDWALFYRHYYAGYYAALAETAGRFGLGGPYIANIPQFWDYDVRGRGIPAPMTSTLFRDFQKHVRAPVLFGGAYQMRRLDIDNFHDVAMATESVNLLHPDGDVPALCAELQTGIMRDRPRLYGTDVELNLKTSTAQGLGGLNGYMFCAGESTDDMGAFGRYHEWQAAVDSRGRPRPHFNEMKRFGRFAGSFSRHLPGWKKSADVALGVYFPYLATEYWKGEWVERLVSQRDRHWFDGLARLLLLNNYQFHFVDVSRSRDVHRLTQNARAESLWLFTAGRMDAETQRRLVAFVSMGGKLIFGPEMPAKDLAGRPCTILMRALGVRQAQTLDESCARIGLLNGWFDGKLVHARAPKSETLIKSYGGKPVVWKKVVGRGEIVFCGIPLQHTFDPAIAVVGMIADSLSVMKRCDADADGDLPLVWRGTDQEGVLFAANYHDRPITARIRLATPKFRTDRLVLPPRKGYLFPVGFEINPGERLSATGELLDVSREKAATVLTMDFPAGRNVVAWTGAARRVDASSGRLTRAAAGSWRLEFDDESADAERRDVTIRVR